MGEYVIALDQGTTSSRAVLIDRLGRIRGMSQSSFPQLFPQPGWVEHSPKDILSSQLKVLAELLVSTGVSASQIDSIGITNQRETTVVWDRVTGEPIHNAIVWQCRRTTEIVERCCSDAEIAAEVTRRTGLIPDAYYSASKIAWILDAVPGARERAEAGELAFGTVDSWLIWNLTQGEVHATDPTNASRTMLFNIYTGQWDEWLCRLFNVPESMLPEVRPSSSDFGMMHHPVIAGAIPIRGVAGDQQAALFGQCCFKPGQVKATFGTGCFLLMSTGQRLCASTHGLVTTVAASAPDAAGLEYALEGSVFMAGALIQWLRDGLGDCRRRFSNRGTCNERARFGGSVRGACVHRAWRSVLGRQCARRHLRIDARGHKSAHSACVPRGASIPGAGRASGHGSRCGNSGICIGG